MKSADEWTDAVRKARAELAEGELTVAGIQRADEAWFKLRGSAELPLMDRHARMERTESIGDAIKDSIERMRPDKDSGVDSVTISCGDQSVTLDAKE